MTDDLAARQRVARTDAAEAQKIVSELAVSIAAAARAAVTAVGRKAPAKLPADTLHALARADDLVAAIRRYHDALDRLEQLRKLQNEQWRLRICAN